MKKLYVEELVVLAVIGDIKANTSWDNKETFKHHKVRNESTPSSSETTKRVDSGDAAYR